MNFPILEDNVELLEAIYMADWSTTLVKRMREKYPNETEMLANIDIVAKLEEFIMSLDQDIALF